MGIQGRVVWHDLMTSDPAAAQRFYGTLFGWRFEGGGEYTHLAIGADEQFGGMMKLDPSHGAPPHWQPYIAVSDVDAAIQAATGAGAKTYMPKTPAEKTGWFAVLADPQGATFAPFQYAAGKAPAERDGQPGPGRFCWDELLTSDPDAAARFYASVFGWAPEHMEMPHFGRYTVFLRDEKGADGKPRNAGGMMKMPPMVPHPFWLAYVAVADTDQTLARARELGATPTSPPMNVEGVGRFATLLDPQGAPFAVLGPGK